MKPKLFITTEDGAIEDISNSGSEFVSDVFAEIGKDSITPTTFKSRLFVRNNEETFTDLLQRFQTAPNENQLSEDNEGESKENEENSSNEETDTQQISTETIESVGKESPETKSDEIVETKDQLPQQFNNIQGQDPLYYIDKYQYKDSETSHVLRFGINIEIAKNIISPNLLLNSQNTDHQSDTLSKTSYKPAVINAIKHHELEINLVQNAISYLLTIENKSILIDIFARHITDDENENGLIKLTETNEIETHTIVLYKISNEQIFIIDPSNYYFSSHIVNIKKETEQLQNISFILPNQKGYKIYSPLDNTKTGIDRDQWRDCTDIAAKLAFGFNVYEINSTNILEDETVKLITNNDKIDKRIIYTKNVPVRQKQQSDIDKIKEFNTNLSEQEGVFTKYKEDFDRIKQRADIKLQEIFDQFLNTGNEEEAPNLANVLKECFLIGEYQSESDHV